LQSPGRQVCSTALLEFGVDQTYSYIACGASARTDIYLATTRDSQTSVETDESATSSTSTTSTSGPASTTEAATSTSDNEIQQTSATSSPSPTEAEATTPQTEQEAEETTTTESPSSSGNNSVVPIGPVVGGVIGGLVIVCATIIAVVYIRRSNRRKAQARPDLLASNETEVYQHHYEPKTGRKSVPGLCDLHEMTGNHRWHESREPAELGT
jgi:cobalamin biosynthesis Mg chelatase CobN